MNLFSNLIDVTDNLLPKDGTVTYYGTILQQAEASAYFSSLLKTIEWRNDEVVMFGKPISTKRKVAWYGDSRFEYSYSNTTKRALLWTKELLELRAIAEKKSGESFNSCLLNLYHDGSEGMSWHSDGEKDLKKNGAIASLSLGAERRFEFKHKFTGEQVALTLEHGSLLVMRDETQTYWLHRLPPAKSIRCPRINLTFRTIVKMG